MNLKWEKPEIKDLNDPQTADGGICNDGSQPTGGLDCTDGGSPRGCQNGAVAYVGDCNTGDVVI